MTQGELSRAESIYYGLVKEYPLDFRSRYFLALTKFLINENDPDIGYLLKDAMYLKPSQTFLHELAKKQSLSMRKLGYE